MSTTLLAVDDSVTMRKVLEITFAGEDFRVVTAESPDAALKKARSEKPSVVLLDVTLPGQDGYSLCKNLKSEVPGIPIIILSSKQGPYDAAKGSAAGADDYIDKPFDTQQMIEKVKKVLAARAAGPARPAEPPPPAPPPKVGGGTIPGTTGPATTSGLGPGPGSRTPQTQTFGSPPPRTTGTQPGAGGAAKPGNPPTPTLNTPPAAEARTRTASGLGNAAATAATAVGLGPGQPPAQGKAQPVVPAQRDARPTPNQPPTPPPAAPTAQQPSAIGAAIDGQLGDKLAGLGLSPAQAEAVLALSREVVERVVWEVVPVLAETLIKEEIRRLTEEG